MYSYLTNYLIHNKRILLLLVFCVLSRICTSIFYIEDIDSLRFALSAIYFDITDSRPHFPGYPIFCFLLQKIYFLIKNIGLTFSIIGGFSIFTIIIFINKIIFELKIPNSIYTTLLIAINPLLWLMSNRYMPDLMGLALLTISLFYLIKTIKYNYKINFILLGVFLGFLAGVRLSFIPFFLPVILLIKNKNFKYICLYFVLSIFIWLIPLVYITDYKSFLNIFINDFNGHFFKWGGTVFSSNVPYYNRFTKIFEFIFVDGFSFWMEGRNWTTIINSIFILIFLTILIIDKRKKIKATLKKEYLIISMCYVSYFIWIYFFQNISHKSRHIIPYIPLVAVFFSISLNNLINKNTLAKIFVYVFICFHLYITLNLTAQHKNQSAISQISSLILNIKSDKIVVISDGLKLFYWSKLVPKDKVKFINTKKLSTETIVEYYNLNYTILSTTKLYPLAQVNYQEIDFYHNPFVNRLWSHLTIYKYE